MKFRYSSNTSAIRALALALVPVLIPLASHAAGQDSPPNIIYILADDLGYGDLSCYGQDMFQTPNLDRLAGQGMRFTQHYAGSTVCAPSRCSLMTGLHTGHAQVRGNSSAVQKGRPPMKPNTVTIPGLLRQAGYTTGMFGKWGLGEVGSSSGPMQYFDEFFGYISQSLAHSYYPQHLWRNSEKVILNGESYSHDLIMDAAKDFIRRNSGQPFFCYLPVTIPHAAMQAPKELHDKYRILYPQFEDKIGRYGDWIAEVPNPVAAFPAMVEHLDNGVGEVMAILEELGIDDNTVVLFSSDNGPHMEGGHDPLFWDCNGPLKGHKRDLYEGGVRVPFIVRWPGRVEAGSESDLISAFWDMLPTFCELAGVPVPVPVDGISLVPELTGQAQPQHDYLYWEFTEQGGKQAIRMGDWKVVRRNILDNPFAPIELYNLKDDLGEEQNVASQYPGLVCDMWRLLQEARTPSVDYPIHRTTQD